MSSKAHKKANASAREFASCMASVSSRVHLRVCVFTVRACVRGEREAVGGGGCRWTVCGV